MKLNIECIRDILLFLEDNLIISDNLEENFFTAQEISAGINILLEKPQILYLLLMKPVLLDVHGKMLKTVFIFLLLTTLLMPVINF